MKEAWSKEEMSQPPLTDGQKQSLIRRIIDSADQGRQYMYKVREAAGLLHLTYDEIQTLLNYYKLDCIVIRGTIIRIPWWSLAEYLIDPAEDVAAAMNEYLKTLPHGSLKAYLSTQGETKHDIEIYK